MHVFYMPLQTHFVKVLVAVRTAFTGSSLLVTVTRGSRGSVLPSVVLGRSRSGGRVI